MSKGTSNRIAETIKSVLLQEPYAKAVYRASLATKGGAFLAGDDKQNLFYVIDELMDIFDGEQLRIANRYRKKLGEPEKQPEPFRYEGNAMPTIPINKRNYGVEL
jgi:hypothetical protein